MNEHQPPSANNADRNPADQENTSQAKYRLRIYFRKGDEIRYISHLDMLRAWERAIRRSGLPLAYSLGFNPHPKITIAMPLAVGCTGENEALDIILEEPTSEQTAIRALGAVMPPGLSVMSAEAVELKGPALTTLFSQALYDILLVDISQDDVQRRVTNLLQQKQTLVEQRRERFVREQSVREQSVRKQFDLRPLIGSLTLSEVAPNTTPRAATLHAVMLHAVLLRDERGRIGRPDVLLQALDLNEHARHIHRTQVIYQT